MASSFGSVSVSATSPQYFYNKLVFPSDNQPSGIAIADVNGDGREDLIVSNTSDNSVAIFLGQMDGPFGSKTDFAAETAPGYVKVGDFNGDRKMDIVVVNQCWRGCSGALSVLLGNGDGTSNFNRSPLAACGLAMGVLLLVLVLLLSAGERKSRYVAVRLAIVFLGIVPAPRHAVEDREMKGTGEAVLSRRVRLRVRTI
jgi:hypothetical protein